MLRAPLLSLFLFFQVYTFFISCAQPKTIQYSSKKEIDIEGMEKDILYYVNAHRKQKGKAPLQLWQPAVEEALQHSKNMAKKKVAFGHYGFEDRINRLRKKISISHAAENVAYGKLTAKEVVEGWLHSAGHKKNIEGNFNLTGIGVAKAEDGTVFFTQIFIMNP